MSTKKNKRRPKKSLKHIASPSLALPDALPSSLPEFGGRSWLARWGDYLLSFDLRLSASRLPLLGIVLLGFELHLWPGLIWRFVPKINLIHRLGGGVNGLQASWLCASVSWSAPWWWE